MPGKMSADGLEVDDFGVTDGKGRPLPVPHSDDPIVSHQHVAVINYRVSVVHSLDCAS